MNMLKNVKTFSTEDKATLTAAQDILMWQSQHKNKSVNIVLATGRTPIKLYQRLVQMYQTQLELVSKSFFLNLDEYIGYAPTNTYSFASFLNHHIVDPLALKEDQYHFWNGIHPDMQAQIYEKEQLIQSRGGLDLVILGLGKNGHIAFNEPGTAFESSCHIVELSQDTLESNKELLDPNLPQPTQAITMGIATILSAKKIIVLAFGSEKAQAVKQIFFNKPSKLWPASVLQTHHNCHFYFDETIAREL
ncbi:glucosamine-6-phosphate deaminase [bacterium]|nr:glucosamine-6-phosphate deaminase [bacterium]